jgi:putative hemolysin
MLSRYGLSLSIVSGSLENIPKDGPLVLVSNHPYGILDGLMMGHILSSVRNRDFRILANRVFRKAEDLDQVILPISFDDTREAQAENVKTRKVALDYLADGGAIGVFPGGTVSTSAKPFSQPMDPGWRSFTAKMIAKSGATVVPVFFEGANSRLFQVASHLHVTLRMALLINEFKRRVDEPVRVAIGAPIKSAEIEARKNNAKGMMDFLRSETYALSEQSVANSDYGFEFEERYRQANRNVGRNF